MGGLEPDKGLTALAPITLATGAGTNITLPLTALRRLQMTMSLAPDAAVADDGAGWAQWISYGSDTPASAMLRSSARMRSHNPDRVQR